MTDDEIASEKASIDRRLHEAGRADHVSVERLLAGWRRTASEVDHYPLTVDDYTNDLTARDALQLVMDWASPALRRLIGPLIAVSDARFREGTAPDTGNRLHGFFLIADNAGWWWSRRPARGRLADYLDTSDEEITLEEASAWFGERGFGIVVTTEDGEFLVHLTRRNGEIVAPNYGVADSPARAAGRARYRYTQEQ